MNPTYFSFSFPLFNLVQAMELWNRVKEWKKEEWGLTSSSLSLILREDWLFHYLDSLLSLKIDRGGEGASATRRGLFLPSGGEVWLLSGEVPIKRVERANGMRAQSFPFVWNNAGLFTAQELNLVQLQGWCCSDTEWVLVSSYYLPNGSLSNILHRNSNSTRVLSWKQRLNIVWGVASALTYLNEECEREIIQRNVQTCNILLDAEFNAKLGDWGLAEV